MSNWGEKSSMDRKIYAPDDTQRDSVSGEFFKNTRLESVVREAIQNSLDRIDSTFNLR